MNLEILNATGGLDLLQQDRCIDCPKRDGGSVGKFAAKCLLDKNYKAEGCKGPAPESHISREELGNDGEYHPVFQNEIRRCGKEAPLPEGPRVITLNHSGDIKNLYLPEQDVYYDYTQEDAGPHPIPDATPLE